MEETTVAIGPLDLDSGVRLKDVEQRVTIYGDRALPAAFLPHALTGSSRVAEWWGGLAGEGKLLDPRRWCVIGINALGGCYGSTGPNGAPGFPRISVRDAVRAQAKALDALGFDRLALVAGGSLGGMQALQWAIEFPHRVQRAAIVGAHDHQTAMAIATNAIQRDAIALDPVRGLRIARKIAMLTYKSEALLRERHDRRADRKGVHRFDVEGYLEHQADLFERRMDPYSYVALTETMDSFDVRGAEPSDTSPELLFVGISSDRLFLAEDVAAAARRFAARGYNATYSELHSSHGHDAFLAEADKLSAILTRCHASP